MMKIRAIVAINIQHIQANLLIKNAIGAPIFILPKLFAPPIPTGHIFHVEQLKEAIICEAEVEDRLDTEILKNMYLFPVYTYPFLDPELTFALDFVPPNDKLSKIEFVV